MISKHSRQRDAIMGFLHGNETHPNAHEIYSAVRETIPNVSLGTIYRNLNQLAEAGEIRKIRCSEGPDRFDFRTGEHGHFICRCCGRLFDVPNSLLQVLPKSGADSLPGRVESLEVLMSGICSDCAEHSAAASKQDRRTIENQRF